VTQIARTPNSSPKPRPPLSGDLAPLSPDPHVLQRRRHYGDPVRILGTMAVVVNHVCDMYLGNSDIMLNGTWWTLNFVDAAMRWAVPAYIMLSGALLLSPERNQTPQTFYKKRLARIGVPLVFWTAFFIWFSFRFRVPRGWDTPMDIWRNLAQGKPYTHLHFIFRIAGLYAFTPIFRIFLRHASRTMQISAVVLCLALACGDSMLGAVYKGELSVFMRFLPFVGYYLLGYLLREAYVSRRGLLCCWVGFLASIAALAGVTGWLIARQGTFQWYPSVQMMFYDFLSPIRIVMAICGWLIFVNTFRHPYPWKHGRSVVYWWASATLGLYLVHPAFREILYFRGLDALHPFGGDYTNVWLGIPVSALLIYVPSLIVTLIIMRIPVVRRIAG
jgi:surface polysaccharide O-acyltransferase-like enzyme